MYLKLTLTNSIDEGTSSFASGIETLVLQPFKVLSTLKGRHLLPSCFGTYFANDSSKRCPICVLQRICQTPGSRLWRKIKQYIRYASSEDV